AKAVAAGPAAPRVRKSRTRGRGLSRALRKSGIGFCVRTRSHIRRGGLFKRAFPLGPLSGTSMLSVYVPRGNSLERKPVDINGEIPDGAVWLDLVMPTAQEDKLVERVVGVAVPTREEMLEIEVTSRLYVENGARYMTATLMCQSDTDAPKTTAV